MDPITAGAAVAGAVGFLGGERSNQLNRKEAARNRAFQSAEAATNRSFQERMRNSEWQAAVADMHLAGINPAVAYSRGGASSPSGAAGSGSQAATQENTISSALGSLMMRKQLKLLDQQINKTEAEASSAQAEASIRFRDQQLAMQKYQFYFGPDGRPTGALRDLLNSQHATELANSARSVSEANLAKLSIPEREAIARVFESVGGAGKGMQLLMPILLQLMRR